MGFKGIGPDFLFLEIVQALAIANINVLAVDRHVSAAAVHHQKSREAIEIVAEWKVKRAVAEREIKGDALFVAVREPDHHVETDLANRNFAWI